MTSLCRECGTLAAEPPAERRCIECGSPRLVEHPELSELTLAHIDCDAFYATVEKRDHPELLDRPVIVGGGHRGVVLACCYVARLHGIRSAMPMFKALEACPDAVVIRPDMAKYRAVGLQVRSLAKLASDLDKPRGFAVVGRGEALEFLAPRPVGLLWGVGATLQRRLARDGITTIGDLRERTERELVARYGAIGRRLYRFSRGEDDRAVTTDAPTKSVSVETTFDRDLAAPEALAEELEPLARQLAKRLDDHGLATAGITLKLKTSRFKIITRSRALPDPTQRAEVLYRAALPLLREAADGTSYRLIGIGGDRLVDAERADPPDLFAASEPSNSR